MIYFSLPQSIDDYKAKLDDPTSTGAVFFAVCRGKVRARRNNPDNNNSPATRPAAHTLSEAVLPALIHTLSTLC